MSRTLTGMKIRTLRKEAGLTQGALARRAGISAAYLNLIEHDRRPVAGELLDRIARGIGVPRGLPRGGRVQCHPDCAIVSSEDRIRCSNSGGEHGIAIGELFRGVSPPAGTSHGIQTSCW